MTDGAFCLLIISIFVLFFSGGYVYVKIYNAYADFHNYNALYKCELCGVFRRGYQLTFRAERSRRTSCPRGCNDKGKPFFGQETMILFYEYYKWMDYVEDFPKLSWSELRQCMKLEKKLNERRKELRAYRAWADNWVKDYGTDVPISEDHVIKSIGGSEYVDLIESDEPIDINSIRKDLGYPKWPS